MSTPIWYFGYGSNMCRAILLEERGMRPLATRRGRLDGYQLCFNIPVGPGERGVANLQLVAGAQTWGVLHHLTQEDLSRLDHSEGVAGGFYQHLPVDVVADDGQLLTAVTYQSSFISAGRKPSMRYLGLLLDGAREHGLPPEYLRELEAVELAEDERPGYPQPVR